MTKRAPSLLSERASSLSLRQRAVASETATVAPPTPRPQPAKPVMSRSRNFVLADMDGRETKENRACSSCIAKLAPREVEQVNWHLSDDQPCRLCQVAQCKPEAFTQPFCSFLQENPTIFHTVEYFRSKLGHMGFEEVSGRMARWTT